MEKRVRILKQSLLPKKLDGLLVTNPHNIRYLTGFTGLNPEEREAYFLITGGKTFFFTDGRYIQSARRLSSGNLEIIEITPKAEIGKSLNNLIVNLKIKRLGFEKTDLRFDEYQKLRKKLARIRLIPTKDLVENLRAQKEPWEIQKIEKAVGIADECFDHLLDFLKPNLTEKEVAEEIGQFIRERGANLAFEPIVAGGPNSALPHHFSGTGKLKTADSVLLDFGAKFEGYCSDLTRMVFLGKITSEQKKIYQIIIEAHKRAQDALFGNGQPVKTREIDKLVRNYFKNRGFKLVHGVGHGVGLSGHENPRLGPKSLEVLKEGMVFSLEPGIYLPENFGVRIEDLVVLKKTGPRILSQSTKEAIVL